MIPLHLVSKLGKYDVEIQGVQFKVSVIDHPALIDDKISELRSSLQNRVAGLDVNFIEDGGFRKLASLVLCVGNVCLVIIKNDNWDPVSDISLKNFLSDKSICFVGTEMSSKVRIVNNYRFSGPCKTGVELGDLGARVLMKPNLRACGIVELGREVGLNIVAAAADNLSATTIDWKAITFTHEQIKNAVHDACVSYIIGNKLVGMLDKR